MASFTSLSFIFRFLPVFLIVYFLVPIRFRNIVTLVGSLVFYAMGDIKYLALLVVLIPINYFLADASFKKKATLDVETNLKRRRLFSICAIVLDVLVLAGFKIVATFINPAIFPLGLSFYIFKMISYQADVYKHAIKKRPTFVETAAYFSMFPQIAQGPIMRYSNSEALNMETYGIERFEEGLRLFVIGLSMKVLLADRIGILWDDVAMYGYDSVSCVLAWMGAFAYSFRLYFDFWGYSLMASGILVIMGYKFIRNFDNPYASCSISEFYRRWHMSLGEFFRDYVYFPLGGSRCEKKVMVRNLACVWLLTGIWHGNGLNFLVWGAVLGIFIISEKLFYGSGLSKQPILGHVYVIVLIPVTWVIFAIGSMKDLGSFLMRLFPFFGTSNLVNPLDFVDYIKDYGILFVFAVVLCIPAVTKLYERFKKSIVFSVVLLVLFWVSVYFCASSAANPFMYLNF